MAKNGKGGGYVGRIPNSGNAVVKAPYQIHQPGKSKVIKDVKMK